MTEDELKAAVHEYVDAYYPRLRLKANIADAYIAALDDRYNNEHRRTLGANVEALQDMSVDAGPVAPAEDDRWAKLLEAIASYVRDTGGGAFIQLGDLALLLAKESVSDAYIAWEYAGRASTLASEVQADDLSGKRLDDAIKALRELEAKHGK